MRLGSSVSNHHCRYLITLRSFGIHHAFLSTTDKVRTCPLVRSLMQYVAARLFVLHCCVLVHIASVVTQHSTTTRMVENQPQWVVS